MLIQANARSIPLADESVQCVVTSPPYWGLRSYSIGPENGEIGLEPTPELYVRHMVEVFREVKRVLRADGTVWLNLGDSYNGSGGVGGQGKQYTNQGSVERPDNRAGWSGLKPKDLCGIPWRVAFALQADGWWLRSDIIYSKPNPMPESVTDRPTKAHEYVFLLSKSKSYYYDQEAVREPAEYGRRSAFRSHNYECDRAKQNQATVSGGTVGGADPSAGRNRRTVWTIPTAAYAGAHFATFPPALVEPCILAGTSERGACPACGAPWERVVEKSGGSTGQSWHNHKADEVRGQRANADNCQGSDFYKSYRVHTIGWRPSCECDAGDPVPCVCLDPFAGTATVGQVAIQHRRKFVGLDLSRPYLADLATERLGVVEVRLL